MHPWIAEELRRARESELCREAKRAHRGEVAARATRPGAGGSPRSLRLAGGLRLAGLSRGRQTAWWRAATTIAALGAFLGLASWLSGGVGSGLALTVITSLWVASWALGHDSRDGRDWSSPTRW